MWIAEDAECSEKSHYVSQMKKNILTFGLLQLVVKTEGNFYCLKTNHATMWSAEQRCPYWSSPVAVTLVACSVFGLLS